MPPILSETKKMKVFPKGQVVIPVSLRKKYSINIGDHIEAIPSEEGILLKPSIKTEKAETLSENLFGIFRKYANGMDKSGKKDIRKATKKGFVESWEK